MHDAYSFLAPIYQPLSRLVFGKDLIRANQAFLERNGDKKLLIIGGGDGVAYRDFIESLQGEFWDLSPKMAQLARRNLAGSGLSIHAGAWPGTGKFDRVFFPFVLDSLTDLEIGKLLIQAKNCLNAEGKVVISDFFSPQTFLQGLIQQLMIFGFRILANHPRKDLPTIPGIMEAAGFKLTQEKGWRKGWIKAQVYELS
jgi:hypothetical protein